MTEHKRFDEKLWMDFGTKLLDKKEPSQQSELAGNQKEFLSACRSGKDRFLKYMQDNLLSKEGIIDERLTPFGYEFSDKTLTENIFTGSADCIQEIFWDVFKTAPSEMLYSCGFWGYIIFSMIKEDYIKPDYLAAESNNSNKSGSHIIDVAMQTNKEKVRDDCVRRILRSMCNPAPRGKRIVFNDFYVGRAVWRRRWANEMSNYIELDFEYILRIFNTDYYGAFSEKMHTSKSYISSKNTFGGLLLFLSLKNKANNMTGKKLRNIIDRLSYLSAWKAIEVQEPKLNLIDIQNIAKSL